MSGRVRSCARAASGHATAAPPTIAMRSRRPISPDRPPALFSCFTAPSAMTPEILARQGLPSSLSVCGGLSSENRVTFRRWKERKCPLSTQRGSLPWRAIRLA